MGPLTELVYLKTYKDILGIINYWQDKSDAKHIHPSLQLDDHCAQYRTSLELILDVITNEYLRACVIHEVIYCKDESNLFCN